VPLQLDLAPSGPLTKAPAQVFMVTLQASPAPPKSS